MDGPSMWKRSRRSVKGGYFDDRTLWALGAPHQGTQGIIAALDVVVRRSEDNGRTWAQQISVCDFGGDFRCFNTTTIVDAFKQIQLLLF